MTDYSDLELVRLLLNDVDDARQVFTDAEIAAFLALEGGNVKRAAAQAIDTNADNEALASKVIRTQDLSTDGASVARVLRERARSLREQADRDADAAGAGYFEVIDPDAGGAPELTGGGWSW